jgi:4-hydroxy-2-oxoheptanedioate aldolase
MIPPMNARHSPNASPVRHGLYAAGVIALVAVGLGFDASAMQPVRLNRAVERLAAGRVTFGILSHDRSLENARALARSGLDFVIIDMEHGPLDIESLRMFLLGMTDKQRILAKGNLQMDVTPLVRLPANGRDQATFLVKQVLDVGAMGVMFPYINTAAEAELAVRAMRYPQRRGVSDFDPPGLRGSGPGIPDWFWGVSNYQELADVWPLDPRGELLSVIQIESEEGLKNVEAIAAVPGVSALFIGPADLALSLGYPADAPPVEAAIQTILKTARSRQLAIGITASAASVERRLKEGFNVVTVGFGDGGITPDAAAALAVGRKALGTKN